MRAINRADEIRPGKCRYRVKLKQQEKRRKGEGGVMKGGAAIAGCKARVCDNNFRLIMMRVMASRVSVAITLHEASEGQVGQLRGK